MVTVASTSVKARHDVADRDTETASHVATASNDGDWPDARTPRRGVGGALHGHPPAGFALGAAE